MLNSSRDKNYGRYRSGDGGGEPVIFLGSKLYYWEDESNARITLSGMGKIK